MNYFELYGLPVLMNVDTADIKKKFHELSRQYQPDSQTTTPAGKQTAALGDSSLVNKAFKVFQNQDDLIKYVLELKGLFREGERYDLDPSFLQEISGINEQLTEPGVEENTGQLDDCSQKTLELLNAAWLAVAPIVEFYQEGITTEKELLEVKDYYYRKKYLQRILDKIAQIRNIASRF
jgi:molecular chaperone HscB